MFTFLILREKNAKIVQLWV